MRAALQGARRGAAAARGERPLRAAAGEPRRPSPRADLAAVAALALLALVAGGPLLGGGYFETHEGAAPLERVIAFAHELRHGTSYPRWLSLADGGKGSAFPHFYAPGFYLAAAHLFAAGVPLFESLKAVLLLALAAGAAGAYAWTRQRLGPWGGLAAGTLYLFAPYHLLDVYVRGALAEFTALAVLPWLFLGIDLAARRRGSLGPAVIAVATAGIVSTHNLSAFLVAPFAAAYLAWAARSGGWRGFVRGALGAGVGAGLSAFYWLPAIADQRHLRGLRAATTSGMYAFEHHFVLPRQLVDTAWGWGASVAGDADGMSFQLGLALLAFAVAGVAAAARRGPQRGFVLCVGLLGTAAVVLTLEVAAPLYRLVPAMPLVQFPWRYLGPATLFLSAAGGGAVCAAAELSGPALRARAELATAAACIAACLVASRPQRAIVPAVNMQVLEDPATLASIEPERLLGVLCGENEYLPRWVTPRASAHRFTGPPLPEGPPGTRLSSVRVAGASATFDVAAPGPSSVGLPWYYFPGWEATIDGQPAAVGPGPEGFVLVQVPPGAHRVRVAYGNTPAGRIGALLSALTALAALAGAAGLEVAAWRRRRAGAPPPPGLT